jgi:hypothetical protein
MPVSDAELGYRLRVDHIGVVARESRDAGYPRAASHVSTGEDCRRLRCLPFSVITSRAGDSCHVPMSIQFKAVSSGSFAE